MGYRSEVMIKVPEKFWSKFETMVKAKCFEAFDGAEIRHEEAKNEWTVDYVSVYFNWVKWYNEYEDVKAFMTTLDELYENEGMSYSFARVGEETGDIESVHEDGTCKEEGYDVDYVDVCISLQ